MSTTQQPEALMQLADAYAEASFDQGLHKRTLDDAPENARSVLAAAVRSQHARITELEAQLSAIGAGGVEPLRKQAAAPQAVQDDEKIQAAPCVTPADVEAAIASEHYYTGQIAAETESQHRALGGILNCTLVMKNGHLVSGEALLQDLSKPDPDRAQASARRRAFDKAYDMVVYAERERVAATRHPAEGVPAQVVELEVDDLIDRLLNAQQDLNLAANVHMDQSIASASTLLDEVEIALRSLAAPQPQGWKLVPVNLLKRIQESLGSFVSDQGWAQSDIDTADALDGLLAAAPQPPEVEQLDDINVADIS